MKYVGGKSRLVKTYIPILMKSFYENNCEQFVDCTIGGGAVISAVPDSVKRIGMDLDHGLIALFKAVQEGWLPPKFVSKEDYYNLKSNPHDNIVLSTYVSYAISFGAKKWGGYAKDNGNSKYSREGYNSMVKQQKKLIGIDLYSVDFMDYCPDKKSLIFVDPPYKGTTGYNVKPFDYDRYYKWLEKMKNLGHVVFCCEYSMPDNFTIVCEKEIKQTLNKDTNSDSRVERLYTLT